MTTLGTVDLASVGHIEAARTGRGRTKTGARFETDLDLAAPQVRTLEAQLRDQFPQLGHKSLRFASLMTARPTSALDQDFHPDSTDDGRINAFVYLSDVPDASHGPIEIAGLGPILGPAGTSVVYAATELHRGVANRADEDRVAVALAFTDSERPIDTIGAIVTGTFGSSQWAFLIVLVLVWAFLVNRVARVAQ